MQMNIIIDFYMELYANRYNLVNLAAIISKSI